MVSCPGPGRVYIGSVEGGPIDILEFWWVYVGVLGVGLRYLWRALPLYQALGSHSLSRCQGWTIQVHGPSFKKIIFSFQSSGNKLYEFQGTRRGSCSHLWALELSLR